jgi:hypothetical protein
MSKADELKKHLQPGQVYRRSDLAKWSKAVDRNMQQLVQQGELQKLSGGVYYCPKKTAFGNLPPEDAVLVRAFLKDDHFYIASLNSYNALGVGSTQLYNEKLVYNYRRDGQHTLNGRYFYFLKRPRFPSESTLEFLIVDLVNNIHLLDEDKERILRNVAVKARSMDQSQLMKTVELYAGSRARSFFEKQFNAEKMSHVA